MSDRPFWFDASIVAAVFATILLSASMFVGFGTFLINLAAVACFVVPVVLAIREGGPGKDA